MSYELSNQSEGIGYIGLSQKSGLFKKIPFNISDLGKILAINPIISNGLIMKEKNILAYSKSIEIVWKVKHNFKNLNATNWCKIKNIALDKDGLLFLQAGSINILVYILILF